jgi:molybdopterin-guanine dinucleotide biosynthesis protein B
VDWVIVEGFKDSDLPKIEVIRPSTGQPAQYDEDPFVLAVATDDAAALPRPTARPVLNLNDPEALTAWLIDNQDRFDYLPERYLP